MGVTTADAAETAAAEATALGGQLRQQAARLEDLQQALQRQVLAQQELGSGSSAQLRQLGGAVAILQQKQQQQQEHLEHQQAEQQAQVAQAQEVAAQQRQAAKALGAQLLKHEEQIAELQVGASSGALLLAHACGRSAVCWPQHHALSPAAHAHAGRRRSRW